MRNSTIIAIDTETHLLTEHDKTPRVVCLSYAHEKGGPKSLARGRIKSGLLIEPDVIARWLRAHLELACTGDFLIVGHNVSYDMACILRTFPTLWDLVWRAYDAGSVLDTQLREQLIDIALGEFRYCYDENGQTVSTDYSLDSLAQKHFSKELDKGADGWRLRYAELDGKPLEEWPQRAVDYAKEDSITALQLFFSQRERAMKIGYVMPTQLDDTRAAFALHLMGAWGICTDRDKVKAVWNQSASRATELAEKLGREGFLERRLPFKPHTNGDVLEFPDAKKNMLRVREAVEKHFPGDVPRTPKGAVKTDKDTLELCNFEPFEALLEFDSLRKTASTYLEKMFKSPIHARFEALGAESGRSSCSGPNLQNQPARVPGVRECFVPRPGYVFLACDFDAQEMRTLAQSCYDICGYSNLGEEFRQNRHFDPHEAFAEELGGPEHRQHAKVANFGFPAGMGEQRFVDYARGWGITLSFEEARELKKKWFEQWPEMELYFRHIGNLVGSAGFGTLTIPQSGFQRGGLEYSVAANGYFQSLAAHASKSALWEVSRCCYFERGSFLYGSRPVLFVHDEIILETPEVAGHKAAQEIEEVLVAAQERWTPRVPAAASAILMRYWSKEAKRVTDEKGRLIPWSG